MTIRPDRYRNAIVPHVYVDGASDGIAFYKRAFGAVELFRMARPNGKILHAEISICGSVVMIGDPDDGDRLRPAGEAKTVSMSDGQLLVRDRPFVETEDEVAGYDIIDCADFDEAIEIASKHAAAKFGKIEIRPVWQT